MPFLHPQTKLKSRYYNSSNFHSSLPSKNSNMISVSLSILSLLHLISSLNAQSCPSGQFLKNSKCQLCPPGTYRNLLHSAVCVPCPSGTFQPYSGALGREYCRECPYETFSADEGATSADDCIPCQDGFTSDTGASRCYRCGPGREPFGDRCMKCREGYYSNSTGIEACILCPGVLTSERGAKSVDECRTCTTNEARRIGCGICPDGDFLISPEEGCRSCKQGFIPGIRGRRFDRAEEQPMRCKSCPKDSIRPDGTFCMKCPDGSGTEGRGASFCKTTGSKGCPSGLARKRNGDCISCKPGEIFDKDIDICIECEEGEIGLGRNSTNCIKCPKGTFPSSSRNECVCPAGEFVGENLSCHKCPLGTSNNGAYSTQCGECLPGFFSGKPGATECKQCPFGSIPNKEWGATSCEKCPDGFMPELGSDAPTKCVLISTGCRPGHKRVEYSDGEFEECKPIICPPGTTQGKEEENGCVGCPAGHRLLPNGLCARCPRNSVSDGGFIRNCKICPGKLVRSPLNRSECNCISENLQTSGLIDGDCRRCPMGTEPDNRGTNSPRTGRCVPCERGTFNDKVGAFICQACPPGTFQGEEGGTACKLCPTGSTPASVMRTSECVSSKKRS